MKIPTTSSTNVLRRCAPRSVLLRGLFGGAMGKTLYPVFMALCVLFSSTDLFAQPASITWALSGTPLVTSSSGNVVGTSETLSGGSLPAMSIFDYNSNGQRLWVGNTGWVAATPPQEDPLRFIQFDAAPTSGNSFTVTNVSFNYGDFQTSTNFNILRSNVYYSTDGWSTRTLLATGLAYLNTTMSSFSQTVGVTLAAGATFSLRIYPYPVLNGLAMTPTFAIHNTVVINGTTTSTLGSICGVKFNDLNGNGVRDASETGLPNWVISLSYNLAIGPVTLTTTTDSLGNYCFNNLQGGGSYTVSETNQAGWVQTFPSAPGTHTVPLTAGENITGINFGNKANAAGEAGACVTWDLSSTNLVTSATGNIIGQPESIGAGSSSPLMSVFLPYSGGQRLWVGTTGWVAGTVDLQRYIEFNASAASWNSLTVMSVSFQYGDNPLSTDFNILKSQVFYSIDGWVNSVPLGTTLSYLNTSVQTFSQTIAGGVVVPAGQVFSLRIFPYSTSGSIAGTPSFAIHSNVVICGTTTSPVSIDEEGTGNELPQRFMLGQNYPNPFNPSTRIQYSLAKAGMVSLKVYNLQGLEVATLVNTHQEAGSFSVPFFATGANSSPLPSGVYFYRLEAGPLISVKKLILMK